MHSDQGRNFESSILAKTLEAFGVNKTRTTAYHPQGDGMVERFNRSLLQLLRAYVKKKEDWEQYLPLVLYAYRTAVHSSTGVSPFQLMFGRTQEFPSFNRQRAFDPANYAHHISQKLAEVKDFVETNLAYAANKQKEMYDKHTSVRTFSIGDSVWLSIPTAGKLDPQWEGEWKVKSVKSPTNVEITDGRRLRIVHINRLQYRYQPKQCLSLSSNQPKQIRKWWPPKVDHIILPESNNESRRRYPQRQRRPPDYYGY